MPVAPRLCPGVTLHHKTKIKNGVTSVFFCLYRKAVMSLFDLILYVPVNNLSRNVGKGLSLSKDKCALLNDTMQ